MILEKVIILIVILYPIKLTAQQPVKNRTTKVNNSSIKKYTYADDENRLSKSSKSVTDKMLSTLKLIREKEHELLLLHNPTDKRSIQQEVDSLNEISEQLQTQLLQVQFNFIRDNSSSFVSLNILDILLTRNGEPSPLRDTIVWLFNNLNKNIQNSVTGEHFKLMLMNMKKSEVGAVAPDFTVNDINNNTKYIYYIVQFNPENI